jgi:TP901 family phage tail tape measure protein
MAVDLGSAEGKITLDISQFVQALKEAQTQTQTTSQNINGATNSSQQNFKSAVSNVAASGAILTAGVTVPVVAMGKSVIETSKSFDQSMANVKAISGATSDEYDILSAKAREMGDQTRFSASDAADAFGYMALAGWDVENMVSGIKPILDLAVASQMDLAQASDIVTDYLTAFGLQADGASEAAARYGIQTTNAAQMADEMAYAQANSNTTTVLLGDAFGNCAAQMNASGQTMETTTAILMAMANQGTKGSEAGTALTAVMRDINQNMLTANDTMDTAKLAASGLTSITGDLADVQGKCAIVIGDTLVPIEDANGNYRDLTDILVDVSKATDGMTETQRQTALMSTFTSRSIKAVNMVLNEGADSVAGYTEDLAQCNGTTAEMSDVMNNTAEGAMAELQSSWEELQLTLGETILPIFVDIVKALTEVVRWFSNLPAPVQKVIIVVAALTAVLGPLMVGFAAVVRAGQTFGQLFGSLNTIMGGATSAIGKGAEAVGNMGSKAAAAAPGVSSAGTSFATLAGQALLLIAAAAAVYIIAQAMQVLVNAAIQLAQAGPGAVAVFVLIAGTAVGVTAAIVALGSACTMSAVGLLALGAAVLMVSSGISLIIVALTAFVKQLPLIAEYGGTATVAILELSGSMVTMAASAVALMAALVALAASLLAVVPGAVGATASLAALSVTLGLAMAATTLLTGVTTLLSGVLILETGSATAASAAVTLLNGATVALTGSTTLLTGAVTRSTAAFVAFTVAVAAAFVPIVAGAASTMALDVALVALFATAALGTAGMLALGAAMVLVNTQVSDIAAKATEAGTSLNSMVTGIDYVKTALNGFGSLVEGTVNSFISLFTSSAPNAEAAGQAFGQAVSRGVQTGLNTMNATVLAAFLLVTTTITSQTSQIGNVIGTTFSTAELKVTSSTNKMMTSVQTGFTQIGTSATTGATRVVTATTKVESSFTKMDSTATSKLGTMDSTVNSKFSSMSNKMQSEMQKAESSVNSSIERMQSAFRNARFEFNHHITLPHFSMNGSFNVQTGAVPSVSVSWYKKAMQNGMIFNDPTIFGYKNGRFLGAGDGNGPEAVVGIQSLMSMIQDAVSKQTESNSDSGDIVIPVYIGSEKLDTLIVKANQRTNLRSGGRGNG